MTKIEDEVLEEFDCENFQELKDKCFICGKNHAFKDCPLKDDVKKTVIARLKKMPKNLKVSIG